VNGWTKDRVGGSCMEGGMAGQKDGKIDERMSGWMGY
jgi:hypothetical protein